MRTIIAGTRRFWSTAVVRDAIRESGFDISFIIVGGAPGIDRAGEDVAVIDRIPFKVYLADWDRFGNDAGMIRNREMRDHPADQLIAIPDSESVGTRGMITLMRDLNLPVYVKELP